jgi:tetratricopeptide (TPR) repeat protein
LASVLRNQGKYREAETILLQVISKYEAILGENHEETLASTTLLGITYYRAKRYSEAEDLFRRVLAGKEETLGCAHASTLATRDNLEASLWKEEKWEEWEPYCRRSLEMRTRVSPDDYDTLRVTSNLWFVLEKLGSDESGKVFERLLNKIKAMPPKLLETKSFQKKMSNDEAWYFKQFCGV